MDTVLNSSLCLQNRPWPLPIDCTVTSFIVIICFVYQTTFLIWCFSRSLTMMSLNCLCTKGLVCIKAGKYDKAIHAYAEALTALKHNFLVPLNESKFHPSTREPIVQVPQYDAFDLKDKTSPSEFRHRVEHPDAQMIFSNPLIIPDGYCPNDQYRFIVTYNLALSYHLCALQRRDGKLLEVALGLWDLIYRFHWNDDLGLVTFHSCAILNNLGHVYRLVGDEKSSRECFESLLSAFLCLQKAQSSDLMTHNADCLLQTVTALVLKDPKTACAA